MATRFAGDFFGIPLTGGGDEGSALMDYFPELRSVKKQEGESKSSGARSFRNTKAVPVFTGFKTFEQPKK